MPPRKRKAAVMAHDSDQDAVLASILNSSSRRRSTRVSSSSAKKSHYFEADSDLDSSDAPVTAKFKSKSNAKAKPTSAKGQRGRPKKAKIEEASLNVEDEDDNNEDAYHDEPKTQNASDQNNADSDFDSDSNTSLQVTFIPLPQLRDLNGVSYSPTTIHPNTFLFLRDLRANNKRSWLKLHDAEYRRSLSDWESYAMSISDQIIESCDETIPELPFKDINFRIYRDIRFSKDPTPYKPHYSASWSRTGRKGPYACYYVHLEPGKCFVGGGLWHPDGSALTKLRASVDESPGRWRRVLMDKTFKNTFLDGPVVGRKKGQKGEGHKGEGKGKGKGRKKVGEDEDEEDDALDEEKAVIKTFCAANAGNALKTKPKGFNADHRDIELLKLRNFTVGKKLPDSVFTSEGGQEQVLSIIRATVPFVTHLNRIVMPDPGDDDDSEEEEA